eukprot:2965389-Rhodomonas_salina.3
MARARILTFHRVQVHRRVAIGVRRRIALRLWLPDHPHRRTLRTIDLFPCSSSGSVTLEQRVTLSVGSAHPRTGTQHPLAPLRLPLAAMRADILHACSLPARSYQSQDQVRFAVRLGPLVGARAWRLDLDDVLESLGRLSRAHERDHLGMETAGQCCEMENKRGCRRDERELRGSEGLWGGVYGGEGSADAHDDEGKVALVLEERQHDERNHHRHPLPPAIPRIVGASVAFQSLSCVSCLCGMCCMCCMCGMSASHAPTLAVAHRLCHSRSASRARM